MNIGLSTPELMECFTKSFNSRQQNSKKDIKDSVLSNDPKSKAAFRALIEGAAPGIPLDSQLTIVNLLNAMMDTIVANNEALAKVISHF